MNQAEEKQNRYVHAKRMDYLRQENANREDIIAARHERKKNKKQNSGSLAELRWSEKQKADAKQGKFDFDTIHGFKLIEVDYTVPGMKERKRKRSSFDAVRTEFLKYIGEHCQEALRNIGITGDQLKQIQKGQTPMGYNTHHKLPIHGGGQNEFSNLILMPMGPHNDLHHKVMDPQIGQMTEGQSKKILIPWSDNMVYVPPEKDNTMKRDNVAFNIAYTKTMSAARR